MAFRRCEAYLADLRTTHNGVIIPDSGEVIHPSEAVALLTCPDSRCGMLKPIPVKVCADTHGGAYEGAQSGDGIEAVLEKHCKGSALPSFTYEEPVTA